MRISERVHSKFLELYIQASLFGTLTSAKFQLKIPKIRINYVLERNSISWPGRSSTAHILNSYIWREYDREYRLTVNPFIFSANMLRIVVKSYESMSLNYPRDNVRHADGKNSLNLLSKRPR